jgi:hypothetical protein
VRASAALLQRRNRVLHAAPAAQRMGSAAACCVPRASALLAHFLAADSA